MFALAVVLAFATVGALALVGARLGGALLARLGLEASAERTIAGTAIGLGVLSHTIFAIGLAGAIGRWLPVALIAIALVLARAPLARLRRPRSRWLMLVALALPPLCLALQPTTAWDATAYHLPLARAYVRSGHIAPVLNVRYPVIPQLEELLFVPGLALAGPIAAALVESLFAALTAAALWAWGRRWFSPRVGVAAALLWLSSPMIIFLATAAYIDVGLTCFATLAVLAAGSAFVERDDRWLVAAGALAGMAASCKYLALPFVAGLGLATLARRSWRGTLGFAVAAALAGAPWYIYNFVHTGNPVFPFAAGLFGHDGPWNAQDLAAQVEEMHSHGVGRSLPSLLLLPWSLTVAQQRFQVEAPFLPLFLPALALAIYGARRDGKVRALLAVAAAYALFWFGSMQILRYLVPASAIFCLAVAGAAQPLIDRVGRRLRVAGLALLLVPPVGYAALRLGGDGFPVTAQARQSYLARALPSYAAIDWLNREQGASWHAYQLRLERMQFFADGRLDGDWFGPWRYAQILPLLQDPAALAARLHELGEDYLIAPPEVCPPPDPHFELLHATPGANVYRLR